MSKFDPKDQILAAADALVTLAASYEAMGFEDQSDKLYRECADLELKSEQLQACWGGPLNGQVGRQRMLVELISLYSPTCIVETGTFRGLTTAWLAERFSGPIWTCEASKRFFYQAVRNLSRYDHVTVTLSDSRPFLSGLNAGPPALAKPLFYLDAHWEQDLPLREELELIMRVFPEFIVVIDDFKVPHDNGYTWDDYGEGNALTIKYFKTTDYPGCRILFPTLPAIDETGARRGCCVISRNLSCDLEAGGLLRSESLEDWSRIEFDHHGPSVDAIVLTTLDQSAEGLDWSRRSYPDQIAYLLLNLGIAKSEVVKREQVIKNLQYHCDLRQNIINDLSQKATILRTEERDTLIEALKQICDDRLTIMESLASMSNKTLA